MVSLGALNDIENESLGASSDSKEREDISVVDEDDENCRWIIWPSLKLETVSCKNLKSFYNVDFF